jgi:GNAT superfamily N-acetyltransferase
MGKIVGFIDGIIYPEPATGKVHGVGQCFYVMPEYRKTNVGVRLYRAILKIAKEYKVSIIEFTTFNKDFWLKKGYTEIKTTIVRELCL